MGASVYVVTNKGAYMLEYYCTAGQIWVLIRLRYCGSGCISGSGVGSGCGTVR